MIKYFPAEAKLTEDDIYWLTSWRSWEYLTSGITSAFDMYMKKHEDGAGCTGDRLPDGALRDINDFGGTVQDVENDYLKYNQDIKTVWYPTGSGFHAEYTTARPIMEGLARLADQYGASVCVHCSETRKEVEECRERTGMTRWPIWIPWGCFRHGGVPVPRRCTWMTGILISLRNAGSAL